MQSNQNFEMQSYIGSESWYMVSEGERPPRSAKLVARIDMGSGPGGGDYRTYLLCTDKKRSGWWLWLMRSDYETGKPLYCTVAYGRPYRGYPAKWAAELLLTRSWEDEHALEGLGDLGRPYVVIEEDGLLTAEDIERIELAVFA